MCVSTVLMLRNCAVTSFLCYKSLSRMKETFSWLYHFILAEQFTEVLFVCYWWILIGFQNYCHNWFIEGMRNCPLVAVFCVSEWSERTALMPMSIARLGMRQAALRNKFGVSIQIRECVKLAL